MKFRIDPITIGWILGLILIVPILWINQCNRNNRSQDYEKIMADWRAESDKRTKHWQDSINNIRQEIALNNEAYNRIDSLGRRAGKWVLFFGKDKLNKEDTFDITKYAVINFHDNLPTGNASFYDMKNTKKWECELIWQDSVYLLNGLFRRYDNESNLIQEINYKNSLKFGEEITYQLSGIPLTIKNYSNNILNGVSKEFNETGQLINQNHYINGQLDGTQIGYFENGLIRSEAVFKQGVNNGKFVEYHENGEKKIEGEYLDGKKCCYWTYIDGNGQVHKTKFIDVRVGAICNDGRRSFATGRGACSHHGGVSYWLFESIEIPL